MLEIIITIMIILSILCGIATGNMEKVSASAIDSCEKAVQLTLYIMGTMALWGGLIRIAEKSGLTEIAGKIITPVIRKILKNIETNKKACDNVILNITANLFGLGNASTPAGINAVKELSKDRSNNGKRNLASFVVLNTASIQLIPTTVCALRQSHGAESPFDIMPCVLLTSLVSVTIGLIVVYALYLPEKKKK